ncbi:MAG: hypothetical protein EPN48_02055 [Microbacteriaceae bacterium]|nr:MAG: hypothetical protein EPN48_02055 [Microbacteriaceae bacterium]
MPVASTPGDEPAGFVWDLTPNDEVDPLVHPQAQTSSQSKAAAQPETAALSETAPLPTDPPATRAARRRADAAMPAEQPFVPSPAVAAPVSAILPVAPPVSAIPPVAAPVSAMPAAAEQSAATSRSAPADRPRSPRGRRDASAHRSTRVLVWVAGALVLVLVLIGLFVLGTRLPMMLQSAPMPTQSPTKTATATPTPTPTVVATGPQSPGTHPWDILRGGECLQPFSTPWSLTFTVVDCATPHAAQLVYAGVFSTDPAAAYPGADQLASQLNVLCSRPGILNLAAAAAFTDAQLQAAYPATQAQWRNGQRSYFCFVNRSGGEPLTGSIAGPGPS